MQIALCSLSLLLSVIGTFLLRRYALAKNIIDTPNARSSHTVPTPRGGGLAIVLTYLSVLLIWQFVHGMPSGLFWSLLAGGGLIAVVGFLDDLFSLSARWRFGFHLLAAAFSVWMLGGWEHLDLGFAVLEWGWLGHVSATLLLAWAINFYNFMDGIDGLAGSEAVFVAGAGGALLWLTGADAMPLWLLAAASTGFLMLNWPPARIFMGDAGSGFLGFALAVHALHATVSGATTIWPWLILIAVFFVDATLTLLRRMARRLRVTDAHRTHAYQWASRRAGAHRPVTLSVLIINLFALWPLALSAQAWPVWAIPAALVSVAVLSGLAWHCGAGVPEAPVEYRKPDIS
ncbi:glycosyltransferase family 4 protein [Uliginosibacterium sp. 31-16]|uniref:MraY family glycosyltransferase n=1 Tax=Uliginosibacterium sp. 31-16 TaxID=3068315 RepID=UPI00273E4BF1|nr:glycosyltransferase family 4 protein [Uliginosibacterium sp. 31-16]MDP5238375.1 glycosyltransferase family 4 protein [Uliginosibacterium sp. 31-16]